jgi:hypothetical protein
MKHDMSSDDENHIPEWWDKRTLKADKEKWKQAVEVCLDFHNIPITHEKFSIEFVKRVVQHVPAFDNRWKKFPLNLFEPTSYKAHQAMYDTIQEEFERQTDEAQHD